MRFLFFHSFFFFLSLACLLHSTISPIELCLASLAWIYLSFSRGRLSPPPFQSSNHIYDHRIMQCKMDSLLLFVLLHETRQDDDLNDIEKWKVGKAKENTFFKLNLIQSELLFFCAFIVSLRKAETEGKKLLFGILFLEQAKSTILPPLSMDFWENTHQKETMQINWLYPGLYIQGPRLVGCWHCMQDRQGEESILPLPHSRGSRNATVIMNQASEQRISRFALNLLPIHPFPHCQGSSSSWVH